MHKNNSGEKKERGKKAGKEGDRENRRNWMKEATGRLGREKGDRKMMEGEGRQEREGMVGSEI